MTFEIERRFLIKNEEWKNHVNDSIIIEQGYFSTETVDWIIRLRLIEDKYELTLKKNIHNFTNYEFEYEIPLRDGEIIMSTLTNKVKKERFSLLINNKDWIIDCFKDKNYPLVIAEIELKEENEEIDIPLWFSEEITGNNIYSNFHLSRFPFKTW